MNRDVFIEYVGYIISLTGALVVGARLVEEGVPVMTALSLSAFAWAGGIFFLLILQRQRRGY